MKQGVYVHIPFCVSRCKYCDFFSTTDLNKRHLYIEAVAEEIRLREKEKQEIQTIYFGGGTPSLLSTEEIKTLLDSIGTEQATEITIEANPGDLNIDKLNELRNIGINRISIGVQSFDDNMLTLIGRRHNSEQAKRSIQMAQNAGFDNISADLMYGLPNQTMEQWQQDVRQMLSMNVKHISCYCLTYEQGTPLYRSKVQGLIAEQDEDLMNEMYDWLCTILSENGYEHYEVSNFAKPNFCSQHNSNYWNDTPYIGIGAGAHSYSINKDTRTRSWNCCNIDKYIDLIMVKHQLAIEEEEIIGDDTHLMEQIMLGMRTRQGVEKNIFEKQNDKRTMQNIRRFISEGLLRDNGTHFVATQKGLHLLNLIIEELV